MNFNPNSAAYLYRKRLVSLIMQTFFLLMSSLLMAFTTTGTLGQVKVTVESSKSRSIDEVFDLIKKQTNYHFVYEQDLNEKLPSVLIKKGKTTVDELLEKVLLNTNYEYLQSGQNTILIKKSILLTRIQDITVKGKVTDKSGMPLPGVTVFVKGSKNGTITDFDGAFNIKVVSPEDILVFSYLGHKTVEVKVLNRKIINQILEDDVTKLDALEIVSTGYQNISKERATGSFQKINESVLDNKISQDIISKIEGEVSGVLFDNRDGVTIRGLSTINANNDPLIIVDGFPISQDLSSINPNDVKNISILKDAAAASIWGIRAANGVIVIVTKKGSNKEIPTVSLSSNTRITSKYDLADLKYAPTSSLLEFEKHRVDNNWIPYPTKYSTPNLSKGLETYYKLKNGIITQGEADNIINSLKLKNNSKEFENLFMANTIWSQYNASIAGGSSHNSYRASLTYNNNKNLNFFKNNDRDEIIANLNNSINLSDKFQMNFNLNFNTTNSKNDGLSFSDYTSLYQYQDILGSNGEYIPQRYGYYDATVAKNYPYQWNYNLKQEFDTKNNDTKTTLLRLQSEFKYDITSYLNIQSKYQYEWGQSNVNNLFNEDTYYVRDFVNKYTSYNTAQAKYVNGIPPGSMIRKEFGQSKTHSARFQLNLDKSFNNNTHNITSIVGYEVRKELSNSLGTTKYGYNPESLTFANVPFGTTVTLTPSGSSILNDPTTMTDKENRFISYFGNAAYAYKNRYILSGSVRLDDANLFGGSSKYRNIPLYSAGVKWNLHEESFMESIKDINLLSIRGTFGSNGNVDNSTSPFLQAGVGRDSQTNNQYAYITTAKNPSLRLEKTYVHNIGLDFGLFNNRLSGNVEYYYKKSIDLLAPVSISSTLGFNSALVNAGEMTNKGIDVQLTGRILNNKNFKYESTINFSLNKNVVTNVDVPSQTINTYLNGEPLEGKPLRYIYSYNYIGLDANGDPLTLNQNGEVIDVNGRNQQGVSALITDVKALVYNGSITPKYYGGWINNFSYKNFNLRFLTTYKFDYVFKNQNVFNYRDLSLGLTGGHMHEDFDNRWLNSGDESKTSIPRLPKSVNDLSKAGYNYYYNAKQFIDDASHIRLKQITLGYNFDSKTLSKMGVKQLELGFQVDNVAVWTFNKWNVDPESMFYKTPASYTFNIKANF